MIISRREFVRRVSGTAVLAFPMLGRASEPEPGEPGEDLNPLLRPILSESGLPALAAGAVKAGRMIGLGAVGLRMVGASEEVTIRDKFHIGSCTKAMTSTLAGMAVQDRKLQWNTTIADVFPERSGKMEESFRKVTLEILLTHRAGLPHDGSNYGKGGAPVMEQRLAYMDAVLAKAPPQKLDTFNYSNAGYIIAGAMLERVFGKPWEDQMRERLFKPLGMDSAGFGVAMTERRADQPWGHVTKGDKFVPQYGDNHRALGPAGTVHCSIADFLKFAALHTSLGARPDGLVTKSTCEKLHTPAKQGYAFGWGVTERSWGGGKVLTHAGSNTMNYFVVWAAPKKDFAIAIASNAAGEKTPEALDRVAGELVKRYCV